MTGSERMRSHESARPDADERLRPEPYDALPVGSVGQPLEPAVREQAEQAYDADLSAVRVHTGAAAQQAARALRARAFTVGSDVVLGADGQRALLHELAHVVQQQIAAPTPGPSASPPPSTKTRALDSNTPDMASTSQVRAFLLGGDGGGAGHEHAARTAAAAARRGETGVSVGPGMPVGIARSPEDEEPEAEQPGADQQEPMDPPPAQPPDKPKPKTKPGRPRKRGSTYVMSGIVPGDRSRYYPPPAVAPPVTILRRGGTPKPDLATPLSEQEAAMATEADELIERLGRPLKASTKAVTADRPVHRQGFGQDSGPGAKHGGGGPTTQRVMAVAQQIGHKLTPNSSKDEGVPGQAVASHAEKQAAIDNPGRPIAVDLAMCPDCFEFFGKLARHRGVPLVVKEPNGTWVFRPDGVRIQRSPSAEVILHPDGRVSAGPPRDPRAAPPGSKPTGGDPGSPAGPGSTPPSTPPGSPSAGGAQKAGPDAPAKAAARPRPTEDQRLMRRLSNELRDSGAELRAANETAARLAELEKTGKLTDAQQATKAAAEKRAAALEKSMKKAHGDLLLLTEPGATDAARNEMRARRGSTATVTATEETTSTPWRTSDKGLQAKESKVTSRLDQGTSRTVTDARTRTATSTGYTDSRERTAKVVSGDVETTTSRGSSTAVTVTGGDLTRTKTRTTKASTEDKASGSRESVATTDTRSVGTGGIQSSRETTQEFDDYQVKKKRTAGVSRADGRLGYQASSSKTEGTVDESGELTKGRQTSVTGGAGIIAGPGQVGVGASGTAGAVQTHRKGVTTGQQVTLGGKVLVTCVEIPGSSPAMFRVGLTINLSGGLTLSGGGEKKAVPDVSGGGSLNVSLTASGSLTGSFTQKMSEDETAAYLGAVRDNKSYGAYRELKVIQLAAHGSLEQAKTLLGQLNAAAGDAKAARALREGQAVEDKKSGELGGALSGGGTSRGGGTVGFKLGYSVSGSILRSVTKDGGKIIIRLEVLRQSTLSGGATGGFGVATFGLSGSTSDLSGQGITFTLDPEKDADFDSRYARIMATSSVQALRDLAAAEKGLVSSSTTTEGRAASSTVTAGVAGFGLDFTDESSYAEAVTTDKDGVSRDITATHTGGIALGGPVGPKVSHKTKDTFAATVRPNNTAKADASTLKTDTDAMKTLGNVVTAPIAMISGAATGSGPLLAERTNLSGIKVDDAEYQALTTLARDPTAWSDAFLKGRGLVNDALQDWQETRRRVLAANGDRTKISRALAEFQEGGWRRGGVIQAAWKGTGGGIRYEFPDELADQKAAYDELIVGDPSAAARTLSEAGKKDEAIKRLTTDIERLDKMHAAITAKQSAVENIGVLGEMLRRIADRRKMLVREQRSLEKPPPVAPTPAAGKGGPVRPGEPSPVPVTTPTPVADVEPEQDRVQRQNTALAACRAMQARERSAFAWIDSEYDHWYRKADVIDVINSLNKLKAMYAEWDSQVTELKSALKAGGAPTDMADQYAPNREKWEAYNRRVNRW